MITVSLNQFRALFGWRPARALDGTYADADDRQILNTLNAFFRPARILELGLNEGRTAELLLRDSPWISAYVGVDVFPDFVPAWSQQRKEIPQGDAVGRFCKDPRLHTVLSTVGTYKGIQAVTGHDFDLIFIDADHTYEGVARDTNIALSVATQRACIVWHDYSPDVPGVMRFLNEQNVVEGIVHVAGSRIAFALLRGANNAAQGRPEGAP